MTANELHPEDSETLAAHFRRDRQVKVTNLDAEICVKATLPPPERRGVILIDPAYEQRDEAARAARTLTAGVKRFPTGIFMLWYPVKANGDDETCLEAAKSLGVPGTLMAELRIREVFKQGGLAGSGVIIVNAPWKLDEELALILPALAERLGLGNWGRGDIELLVPHR
jgi:23S rRNA (adenine2030-N6)-methyltransferase